MQTQIRKNLRQHYRQYRRNLNAKQQAMAASDVVKTALKNKVLSGKHKIACYLTNDGELDLMPLIQLSWSENIDVYLPVLHPFAKGHLLFLKFTSTSLMTHNRFGIIEPKLSVQNIISPIELDCIFVPLVAFDTTGNRLGMGGGFYDRTLASVISEKKKSIPQLIGVAHDGQLAEALPSQGWDIPMQAILTPRALLTM